MIAATTAFVAVGGAPAAYAAPECCSLFNYDTCANRGINKGTCTAGNTESREGKCCVEITQKQANCYYQQTRYTNCTVPPGQCTSCVDRDLTTGEYDGNAC
ncbi:MAG: hypothetical protein COZ05_12955 [Armatimonadetes bacterium CG_4_10_14_3_um_filter_59_10]|nr:MAG: hypothetical protein COZ05_12955 [Armatimonadetes bacterium CG_4_10_14_3_um_filter_59_10]